VLRYAGQAAFKGFEKEGGIDVWEIILAESAFCRDLLAVISGANSRFQKVQAAV